MNSDAGRVERVRHNAGDAADGPVIPGMWLAGIVASSLLLVCGLLVKTGIGIRMDSTAFAVLFLAILALGIMFLTTQKRTTPRATRLRDFSEYALLFMAFSLLGVVSSYPVAAFTSGFVDAALIRGDALMWFDWNRWYDFVVAQPALRVSGAVAYSTIFVSPALLLGYMAWHAERAAARQFLVTFWLAAVLTLLFFPLFPAKGPLAVMWSGPIPYMPTTALYQSEVIPQLRDAVFTQIDLGALGGLVCAPSFHTVSGVLYIAAAWPFQALRWPLTVVNGAMLLSTPVEGNHYLTDMILGLLVALAAIALMRGAMRLFVRWPGRTLLKPQPQMI